MSFILEEGSSPDSLPCLEQDNWIGERDELPGKALPYEHAHVAKKETQRLRTHVTFLWIFNAVLQSSTIAIAVCASTLTYRGRNSTSWPLALTLVNYLILALAIGAGAWGLRKKNARLLKQSSSIMIALCAICVFEWCYELLFILVFSRRAGKWQKGGQYTAEQIWEFNAWIIADVAADVLSIGVCFISSHHTWELAKVFEMEEQTEVRKKRNSWCGYGTFHRDVNK
ncbi:putative transmembrane protein [Toxoplasma gondii RUB]|uniref:Transmembrane protein n=11 Tax=Toxoplasma gondii TaxID=5811 RepID=S7UYU5_TOXGG|nr:hypothetical protein TGGT1_259700 [Toxoplasma gondii GT1]KAF4641236.1 hypothetical protein TGRH88_070460 [Toxoplasma gondii]KFG34044.1 putative transmembrane protein [Toxoplasma gondii GAB2-2007-GAL-DOM2]KFG40204.1 putative transmembrane protein [Toxoplasma gondii p89]KFG40703.1 putative transmembrane protein [Toxoplasma gondii FOU]KFG65240.1 putative transmembrane protein [Toxoplasma gondii RUB]KFH10842.1 putative transmembrane protein [Toxoplasma gondii VAND]PUA84473.1 putative transmem